ncbi:MAG: Peptidoglycan-binding lysin domain protein [Blastococcus sp.]|jgi:hypothetical protein|nr:Peptidoglycan-binding lysin domain protein [Blastococcus sp.]
MGCVQQAVLEFDEEVRAPWRPRLVAGTGVESDAVQHPSRCVPKRVAVREPIERRTVRARRRHDPAARRVAMGSVAVPPGQGAGRPWAPRVAPARTGRARLRPTRRARRLAVVLALASGVALGSWLGPLVGGAGELRLAGESSVVVQSGDTLWSIATFLAGPGDDVRAVVDEIQRTNGLRSADLAPGQVLQLP